MPEDQHRLIGSRNRNNSAYRVASRRVAFQVKAFHFIYCLLQVAARFHLTTSPQVVPQVMSSRYRQSASGSVATTTPRAAGRPAVVSTPDNRGNNLPTYQPPIYSLNDAAHAALAALHRSVGPCSTKWLEESFTVTAANLAESAGEINDRLTERVEATRKAKSKRARDQREGAEEADAADDEEVAKLRDLVERMTQRMDAAIRSAIDGQTALCAMRDTVSTLQPQSDVSANSAQTQTAGSQATLASTHPFDTPAAHTQTPTTAPALASRFGPAIENHMDKYMALPAGARYADHNDYVSFKRTVHDAQHPGNNAPPMPNASTWFPSAAAPMAGVTARTNGGAGEDTDSDDEIAIAGQTISTRCPLTLQEFKTPLTSKLCPHSFEKSAIMSLIKEQRPTTAARGRQVRTEWTPTVQCPVPGCQKVLGEADLRFDVVLVRKIKRAQRIQEAAEVAMADDVDAAEIDRGGEGNDIDEIDEVDSATMRRKTARRLKSEVVSQREQSRTDEIEDD